MDLTHSLRPSLKTDKAAVGRCLNLFGAYRGCSLLPHLDYATEKWHWARQRGLSIS